MRDAVLAALIRNQRVVWIAFVGWDLIAIAIFTVLAFRHEWSAIAGLSVIAVVNLILASLYRGLAHENRDLLFRAQQGLGQAVDVLERTAKARHN